MIDLHEQRIIDAILNGDVDYISALLSQDAEWPGIQLPQMNEVPFLFAAKSGQLVLVKLMLEKNRKVLHCCDSLGQTALLWASAKGHADVVDYLASQGADLNAATSLSNSREDGFTSLHWAIIKPYQTVVEVLLRYNANIDIQAVYMKYHPIHLAAKKNLLPVVQLLLGKHPDCINVCDECGQTALLWAASLGYLDMVTFLLSQGADVTLASANGKTALHWAFVKGHDEVAKRLLSFYPALFNYTNQRACHPIHLAAVYGRTDVIMSLLTQNPQLVHLKDLYGKTPILLAGEYNHLDLVKQLISFDASLILQHPEAREHLIHLAARTGFLELCAYLLEQYPQCIDLLNANGETPLMLTAIHEQTEIASILMEAGANLVLQIDKRQNPYYSRDALWLAMEYKSFGIANLIILKQFTINSPEDLRAHLTHGLQVLDLMRRKPEWKKGILETEAFRYMILSDTNAVIDDRSLRWYQTKGRRNSIYTIMARDGSSISEYKPDGKAKSGSYGSVRLFKNAAGDKIAVKKPLSDKVNLSEKEYLKETDDIRFEAQLHFLAYPENHEAWVFMFNAWVNAARRASYRYIMPFVEGELAWDVLANLDNLDEVAELILSIARDLDRIHHLGIIHTDCTLTNVMIHRNEDNQYVTRFIDFGLAEQTTSTCSKLWPAAINIPGIPPEMYNVAMVKPHKSQDVYIFAFSMADLFKKINTYDSLIEQYPAIGEFLTKAQNSRPACRPQLKDFCADLAHQIDVKKEQNAPLCASASLGY